MSGDASFTLSWNDMPEMIEFIGAVSGTITYLKGPNPDPQIAALQLEKHLSIFELAGMGYKEEKPREPNTAEYFGIPIDLTPPEVCETCGQELPEEEDDDE